MYIFSIVDASANNIPTSFDTSTGSQITTACPSAGFIGIISTCAQVLALVSGLYKVGEVPSSTLPGRSIAIPAAPTGGSGVEALDWYPVTQGDSIYIRSTGTSISSGKVYIFVK